jgi:1,4-alpha-glucan branching enzyme
LAHYLKSSDGRYKTQCNSFSLMHKSKIEIVMSIKKQFIKTKPVCKVTFSVEAKEAIQASVIGDFNNWNPEEGTLNKLKNGTFKGVFSIDKDASYEFKYIIDGAFVNETESDSFLWNEFSGNENGVLTV